MQSGKDNWQVGKAKKSLGGDGMKDKYRAWIKAENKMAPVAGLTFDPSTFELSEIFVYDMDVLATGPTYFPEESYFPDEVILMQSTGVVDCNGREIFDGDRIRIRWYTPDDPDYLERIVRFSPEFGSFDLITADGIFTHTLGEQVDEGYILESMGYAEDVAPDVIRVIHQLPISTLWG